MADVFSLDIDALLRVLNYLNAGVYITDTHRCIVLWNRKAEEITGFKAKDVVGKACHENVLNHTDKDGHRLCFSELCPLYRSILTGQASREPVLVYVGTDSGRRIAMSVSVAPLRDDSGEIIGGIEVFNDETNNVAGMEFARNIQQSILPAALPSTKDVRFDVRYYPQNLVGGDFYDVRQIQPSRYGIMVADVCGHGLSAALYTMLLKSLEENHIESADSPSEFLAVMNRELSRFIVDDSFVTMFYGVLDVNTWRIDYANAGHLPPLCVQNKNDHTVLTECRVHAPPLGIIDDVVYEQAQIKLNPGDLLLCYTDGITEVYNKDGQMLDIEGLGQLLEEIFPKTDDDLLERLYEEVMSKSVSVSPADDVLLLSVKRTPTS